MASHFVEVDKEFIEETQVITKTQKRVWTTGLKFSNNGKDESKKWAT